MALPGESWTIRTEPIEVPDQVPSEPVEKPTEEPVPA